MDQIFKMFKKNYVIKLLIIFVTLLTITFFAVSHNSAFNKDFVTEMAQSKKAHNFRLVSIICSYLNKMYVEPDRIKPKEMLRESLSRLERIIPEVRVDIDEENEEITIFVDELSNTVDTTRIKRLGKLYKTLNDSLNFINDNINHEIKTEDIEYAAINGMLSQLDPHSIVFPPKDFDEFKIGTSGKFGGLGMVVGIREGMLTIISPIEGTPAYRAGLKSGDKIIAIDENSTINMSLQEAVSHLRGDPSTTVILTIETSKLKTTKSITLTREIIAIPSVDSKLLKGSIGYIKIRNFQEDTTQSLEENIAQLRKEGGTLNGVILDLRNNSGGLLDQAITVSDKFLSSGIIVVTVGPMGKYEELQKAGKSSKDIIDCPLVVIINSGSASGAEIVAGALKDNNRAVLIGDLSFGKGSIQQLLSLIDGAALKLTVGKYLTPNFTDIQSVGIMPDILLVQTRITEKEIILFNEDLYAREKDLKKHLDESTEILLPFEKVKYLSPVVDKKEDEDYYKLPDMEKDTHIQFAMNIISNLISNKKNDSLELELLKPTIEDFRKREEGKIFSALDSLGIDWSTAKTNDDPITTATALLTPSNNYAKAGDEIILKISVTNNGKNPLYQLRGITESENLLLNKREFLFGKINSGETKSYEKKIKIPERTFDRHDEFTVKFSGLGKYAPADIKGTVNIEALPRPTFAFSYQIIDEGIGLKGNGDGIIQKGEEVDLVLTIKNVGLGISKDNIFALRNLSDEEVFIQKAKLELGELLPGKSKSVRLKLSVRENFNTDNFTIDITIADTTYGTRISDKMTFYVDLSNVTEKIKSVSQVLKVKRDNIPIYNGKSLSTAIIAYANKAALLASDKQTKSWFRVNMSENRFGWVPYEDVEINGYRNSTSQTFQDIFLQNVPPLIELDIQKPKGIYSMEHFPLSGIASDDKKIKYIYILVNEDKVFYKSYKGNIGPDGSKLTFSCDVPLKDGPNIITVVAKDDQDLQSTRSFVITRKSLTDKVTKLAPDKKL